MQPLIETQNLTKKFGELTAVDTVSYIVEPGRTAGVIGPNGSGKTTLFNLLSGFFPPTMGRIKFDGEEISHLSPHRRVAKRIVRTFQLVSVFSSLSVWENLVLPVGRFNAADSGASGFFLRQAGRKRFKAACREALSTVDLAERADLPADQLSYGDKRMLEIGMALALQPRLLLLDEPLAGLSDHEITNVIALLNQLKDRFTLVIIEHKISKIMGLVEHLCVMNEGRLICQGDPEAVLEDKEVRACYWGKEGEAC
jgi:branched-chain amino acid transport system ATP-binding protein